MKIHISNSAKEALDAIGGYYTELRGTFNIEISIENPSLLYNNQISFGLDFAGSMEVKVCRM